MMKRIGKKTLMWMLLLALAASVSACGVTANQEEEGSDGSPSDREEQIDARSGWERD